MVKSREDAVGRVMAIKYVKNWDSLSGGTYSGMILIRTLLRWDQSKSNTFTESCGTSFSNAVLASISTICDLANSAIFLSTCSVLETRDWTSERKSPIICWKTCWKCLRRVANISCRADSVRTEWSTVNRFRSEGKSWKIWRQYNSPWYILNLGRWVLKLFFERVFNVLWVWLYDFFLRYHPFWWRWVKPRKRRAVISPQGVSNED